MTLREWLIVVGVLIILGILIDGLRRMRLAKQDSLKMSRDLGGQIEKSPIDDDFNPELPGGGARVVSVGDDSGHGDDVVSGISASDDFDPLAATSSVSDYVNEAPDPIKEPELIDEVSAARVVANSQSDAKNEKASKTKKGSRKAKVSKVNQPEPSDSEVIVINVDAQPGGAFPGEAIKNLLEACGLEHGEMSIFHRHEEDDLLSPIQFSVANAVEPGYFDPATIGQISTPGVSFFMSIPGPKDYIKAFEYMHETAKCFADNLDGELKDENRSVLTSQTIEHCKQRIREFERKQLCKARP